MRFRRRSMIKSWNLQLRTRSSNCKRPNFVRKIYSFKITWSSSPHSSNSKKPRNSKTRKQHSKRKPKLRNLTLISTNNKSSCRSLKKRLNRLRKELSRWRDMSNSWIPLRKPTQKSLKIWTLFYIGTKHSNQEMPVWKKLRNKWSSSMIRLPWMWLNLILYSSRRKWRWATFKPRDKKTSKKLIRRRVVWNNSKMKLRRQKQAWSPKQVKC